MRHPSGHRHHVGRLPEIKQCITSTNRPPEISGGSLFVNDSLIANQVMQEEAFTVEVGRFAEQSALMIVDNKTEIASVFDLSEKGGTYQFEKETDGIKQLAK